MSTHRSGDYAPFATESFRPDRMSMQAFRKYGGRSGANLRRVERLGGSRASFIVGIGQSLLFVASVVVWVGIMIVLG